MTNNTATRPARVTRGVDHARSYGPLLRFADRVAGIRDRKVVVSSADGPPLTPLVVKLQATFDENDRRILAHTQDLCQHSARRLRELTAHVHRLDALIAAARGELDEIDEPTVDELSMRNGGELHLNGFAVLTRRRREHRERVATACTRIYRYQEERDARLIESAGHAARLDEEYELARTISERLRHYYDRRLANYARAARIAGSATPHISTPSWTTAPCPWSL